MSAFTIKIIAIVTMVIDHVGLFFFPELGIFRLIGRLAFPLFAWLIANGAHYTKNIHSYLLRLFIFGLISQVPFILLHRLNDPNFFQLNIFFTLSLGLLGIILTKNIRGKLTIILISVFISLIGLIINTEYELMGVLLIIIFYYTYKDVNKLITSAIAIISYPYFAFFLQSHLSGYKIDSDPRTYYQLFSIFALLFISLYNHKQGPKFKYFFYIFYPAHLLIILLLRITLFPL